MTALEAVGLCVVPVTSECHARSRHGLLCTSSSMIHQSFT